MESAELKSGSLLKGGEYRIVKPLGQGGFGITYLAEQVSLGRKVAVKEFFMKDTCEREGSTSHVTVPTASNRELVAKFKNKFIREARMIASFKNPNIIKIYDVFEENGTAYYVMDFIAGESLADIVKKRGPLSCREAEKCIRDISSALDYIHSRNTTHLDVKPSNVLLDEDGNAVLIDFGVSKHYDESGQQTSSTPVGISKGYAPLEQSRTGDVSQFTPSTDIYALGATLYNLVTGQTPPEASIVNEEGLPSLPSSVPPAVNAAITSAMQPKRKDRPQSIGEFLKILDGRTGGQSDDDEDTEPVGGKDKKKDKKDPDINPEPSPTPKRNRWIAIAAAALAAILCVWLIPKFTSDGGDVPVVIDDADTVAVAENVPDKKTESPAPTKTQPSNSSHEPAVPAVVELKSITLNKSSLELEVGETASLTVKYTPSDATDRTTTWKSTDTKVITVSSKGKVTAVKAGTASIIAKCGTQDAYCNITVKAKLEPEPEPVKTQPSAQQSAAQPSKPAPEPVKPQPTAPAPKPTTGSISGHEYVDLGMPSGLLWATCNVGTSSPSDYGSYFAWGETSTKGSYYWSNLKYCNNKKGSSFSKYNKDKAGIKDNKTRLELSDDAARANWGGSWRMPTKDEWVELESNCTWTWTSQGGHNGYKVTGKNGNSIFLPVAGWRSGDSLSGAGERGYYWSSSLNSGHSCSAYYCYFGSSSVSPSSYNLRVHGQSVRPVSSSL